MLSWDLDKRVLRPTIQFLIDCRPHCVSMGSAIKHLRNVVARIPPELSETDAKVMIEEFVTHFHYIFQFIGSSIYNFFFLRPSQASLLDEIDKYISERITVAMVAIANHGAVKVMDGDVVLTYGCSSLVRAVLEV